MKIHVILFKNRAKSGNLARFSNRVKSRIVLIEIVLSGDPLYPEHVLLVFWKKLQSPNLLSKFTGL